MNHFIQQHKIKYLLCGILAIFFIQGILMSSCFAGRLKSAESSLTKLENSAKVLENDIKALKLISDSSTKPGSFITTGFWGAEPRWYSPNDLLLRNMESDDLQYGNKSFRKIKNVSLYPDNMVQIKGAKGSWHVKYLLNFSEFFGLSSRYRQKHHIIDYFENNEVSPKNHSAALDFYFDRYENLKDLLLMGIVTEFSNLFEHAVLSVPRKGWVKIESLPMMKDSCGGGDYYGKYGLASLKDCFFDYPNNGDHSSLQAELTIQFYVENRKFIVAKDKAEGVRYSQLADLTHLLDGAVQNGKAVVEKRGDISYYRDAQSPGAYRASFNIDLKSGVGEWCNAMFEAEEDMKKNQKNYEVHHNSLNIQIKNYLDATLLEAVRKFGNFNQSANDDRSSF